MKCIDTKRILLAGLWLGLSLGLAAPAFAGRLGGGGPLDDVDPDARTVTVRDRTYTVGGRSDLRDARGRRVALYELERSVGGWVTWSADPGTPHPVLDRLRVEDDED